MLSLSLSLSNSLCLSHSSVAMGDNFNLLCDELLLEILRRIPPSSSPTISLVCCRWLNLHRSSKTILSVRLPPAASPLSLSSLLSHYPSLSSLTLIPHPSCDPDSLLLSISSSNLSRLRFLAGPTSPLSLQSQPSIRNLTSLSLSSLTLLSFRFLILFPNLRDLAVLDLKGASIPEVLDDEFQPSDLPIETLSLSGIGSGNLGLGWLWLSCRRIRRLRLRSCEGTGDLWEFAESVAGLVELELRTCRTIADRVLFLVAQESASLNSLVLYDGGSRDGLLNFLTRTQSRSSLRKLDLRLPLDLEDVHLVAISGNFGGLSSVKLQSCCLVTGLGLELLGPALSSSLEELVLVNCDAVEKEPGLLTSLGQNLRRLKKLDLSYNEMLMDKELGSMLASCGTLVEIRLRGCGGLTDSSIVSMIRSCKVLEVVDIRQCRGIGVEAIEVFLSSLLRLGRIMVEESKLTDSAKMQVSRKIIQVG